MQTRIKVFIIHAAISVLIAIVVMTIVFHLWYPSPLHTAIGVTNVFITLLAIDVTLGPLLTFLVYETGKRTLIFDLTIIFLIQISALAYGLHTIAEGRPAWLVFAVDRFDLIQVLDIDQRKIDQADLHYQNPSLLGPQWVAAENPNNSNELNDILIESVVYGIDITQRPNLYQSLESKKTTIQQRLLDLPTLSKYNTEKLIQTTLDKHPSADAWLPLRSKAKDMVVLMQRDSGTVVAIVDLRPWD